MEYLVKREEMASYDQNTSEYFKVPSLVLMERAALSTVEQIEMLSLPGKHCLVVCGMGNNGGDGMAVARLLRQCGYDVLVVLVGNPLKMTKQTRQQYESLMAYQLSVKSWSCDTAESWRNQNSYDLIVDALFGIGLSRTVEGEYKRVIQWMNECRGYKLSIDIASGVDTDSGQILGSAFRADETVTFGYRKLGQVLYPGAAQSVNVVVQSIGITDESFLGNTPKCRSYGWEDLRQLPARSAHSHKGTFGKVLLIAGSRNMAGACYFAGKAAYFTGCGLVKVLTAEENRIILQQNLPQAVLLSWDANGHSKQDPVREIGKCLKQEMEWCDVIAIGPGLGQSKEAEAQMEFVLRESTCPLVIDADGLNLLSQHPEWYPLIASRCILTPHLLEMSRLCKKPVEQIQQELVATAQLFSKNHQVICVLKDARTVVATQEESYYVNQSGNSGMAVGGSGDVLTGIIAGLLAQHLSLPEAARLGVYLHGLCGDVMSREKSAYSLQAEDIIDGLARVTEKIEKKEFNNV